MGETWEERPGTEERDLKASEVREADRKGRGCFESFLFLAQKVQAKD